MKDKLYILKCSRLKKIYKTHYFLCLGQKELITRRNFGMKQFVNITSGTIVDAAIWKIGIDIEEIYINENHKELIKNIIQKKKVKNFIMRLEQDFN